MFQKLIAALCLSALLACPADAVTGTRRVLLSGKSLPPTTFDPINIGPGIVLSNGNLTALQNAGTNSTTRAIAGRTTGKYYHEIKIGALNTASNLSIGLINSAVNITSGSYFLGQDANSVGMFNTGSVFDPGNIGTGATFTNNTVIGVATNLDNKKIWYTNDGINWNGSSSNSPSLNIGGLDITSVLTTGPFYPAVSLFNSGASVTANFGATPYSYTKPF